MRTGSTDINNAMKDYYVSWLRRYAQLEYKSRSDHTVDRDIEDYKVSFTTKTHAHLALQATDYHQVQVSRQSNESIVCACVD
jgi:hypothetical protein